jgi:hypothetical protein
MQRLVVIIAQQKDAAGNPLEMALAPHKLFAAHHDQRVLIAHPVLNTVLAAGLGRMMADADAPCLIDIEPFAQPVRIEDAVADEPFEISAERFDALMTRGLATTAGLAEAAVGFTTSQAELTWLIERVRARSGGACELTGIADKSVSIGVIQPVPLGGARHPSNMLALTEPLWPLFSQFALSLGPAGEILVDLSLVPPDIRVVLNPNGRLRWNGDAAERPREKFLAWHRDQFWARLRA